VRANPVSQTAHRYLKLYAYITPALSPTPVPRPCFPPTWNQVRRVERYGVFVDLARSNVTGLAHISQVRGAQL